MKSRRAIAASVVVLFAGLSSCSSRGPVEQEVAAAPTSEATLSPGVQSVRIGESGPGFAACNAAGAVTGLPAGDAVLTVHAAPFVEANGVTAVPAGARIHVCSRSLDQRWLGIVVVPAGSPPDNDGCGVSAPVTGPRAYAGPCRAGWVPTAFVRISAG